MREKCKKAKKNNKGVTLIEVLVASIMLALLAIPILSSFITATRINVKAKERQETTFMSQDIMEEIKAESLANIDAKISEAIANDTQLVLGGQTMEPSQIAASMTKSADDKFVDEYDYTFTDVDGYDIHIVAVRDTNYGSDGGGYSEFGEYQLPQNFKYRITIDIMKTGQTEIVSTVTGTTLELIMVTYDPPAEES